MAGHAMTQVDGAPSPELGPNLDRERSAVQRRAIAANAGFVLLAVGVGGLSAVLLQICCPKPSTPRRRGRRTSSPCCGTATSAVLSW